MLFFSISFQIQAGKEGIVDFSSGQESMVYKDKNGHLMVVSNAIAAAERSLVPDLLVLSCQLIWPLPTILCLRSGISLVHSWLVSHALC